MHVVKTWGTATFVGLGAEVAFDVRAFLGKQITIMTSWSMSIRDQKACADFIVERGTDIDSLFTDSYRLDEADTWSTRISTGKAAERAFFFSTDP